MDFKALDWFNLSSGAQCVVTEAPHDEPDCSWLHYVVRIEGKKYKITGIERMGGIGALKYKKGDKFAMMVKEWPC